jgi:hypothetical protein
VPAFLLAIIAGCLLFGGAAVLGFLEAGLLIVIVFAVLALAVAIFWFGSWVVVDAVREGSSRKKHARELALPKFIDQKDYLDWANREGRWADRSTSPTPTRR